jgi:hypothetical protein
VLRAAFQTHRGVGYLLAGSKPHLLREMAQEGSTFYRFGRLIELGPVAAETWDALTLVQRRTLATVAEGDAVFSQRVRMVYELVPSSTLARSLDRPRELSFVAREPTRESQGSFRRGAKEVLGGSQEVRPQGEPWSPRPILALSLGLGWGWDDALATVNDPSTRPGETRPVSRVFRRQPVGHTPASGPQYRGTSPGNYSTRRRESRTRAGVAAAPVIVPAAPPAARAPPGWPSPRSGPSPPRSPGGGPHTPDSREYRPQTPKSAGQARASQFLAASLAIPK